MISDLKERYKKWAISVVIMTRQLPSDPEFKACRNQIVRSAPSVAANYRAACRGKSNPDFINKLKIVEEELDETMFWIEFITELLPVLGRSFESIYEEANELLSITVASIKTARNKQK
jgi:four helix bundle protein